jgi:hypothetical protein
MLSPDQPIDDRQQFCSLTSVLAIDSDTRPDAGTRSVESPDISRAVDQRTARPLRDCRAAARNGQRRCRRGSGRLSRWAARSGCSRPGGNESKPVSSGMLRPNQPVDDGELLGALVGIDAIHRHARPDAGARAVEPPYVPRAICDRAARPLRDRRSVGGSGCSEDLGTSSPVYALRRLRIGRGRHVSAPASRHGQVGHCLSHGQCGAIP